MISPPSPMFRNAREIDGQFLECFLYPLAVLANLIQAEHRPPLRVDCSLNAFWLDQLKVHSVPFSYLFSVKPTSPHGYIDNI